MDILIENDSSFEFVASQLQQFTTNILCVKDGCRLMVYSSESSLPKTLKYNDTCYNELIQTTEYYYRCNETDDLYVFFRPITIEKTVKMSPLSQHKTVVNVNNFIPKGTMIEKEPDVTTKEEISKIVIFR